MAKKIYTLQHYKMNINDEEVWQFAIVAYPTFGNALNVFGKSYCSEIKLCIEEFMSSRAEARRELEKIEKYMLETRRKIFNYKDYGSPEDYNWDWNEEERTNYGTLKNKEQ